MGRMVWPLQEWLEKLARRLDEEQARVLKTAALVAQGPKLMHMKKEALDKAKPTWVDKGLMRPQYPGVDNLPANANEMIQKGYPRNIQDSTGNLVAGAVQQSKVFRQDAECLGAHGRCGRTRL
jgi:hypothetical protein